MISYLLKLLVSKALPESENHTKSLEIKSEGEDRVLVRAKKDNGEIVETEVTTFSDKEMEKIDSIQKSVMAY